MRLRWLGAGIVLKRSSALFLTLTLFLSNFGAGGPPVVTILNPYSHPGAGGNWVVDFETRGVADLTITPSDQATVDDLDFVSLKCDDQLRTPQLLENGGIFYPDWHCGGTGEITHHVKEAGKHALRFQFGGQVAYAHNSPGWLSGYSYRKQVTIEGQSGAGTDYQVLLKVGESSGSPDKDLHVGGRAEDFPNDVRFTDDDETTELSYWLAETEGSPPNRTAHFWVKVGDDLDTDRNIYVYYGSPSADSASSGEGTFSFFDSDFGGLTYDVAVADDENRNEFGPQIAEDSSGTLYVVYRIADDNVKGFHSSARVVLKKSSDDGLTWGDEIVVADEADIDDRNPGILICDIDGTETVFVEYNTYAAEGGARHAYIIRSTDGGETWGSRTSIQTGYEDEWGTTRGNPILLSNGIVLAVWHRPDATRTIYSARSSDGGDTWSNSILGSANQVSETSIIETKTDGSYQGGVYASIRNLDNDSHPEKATSTDYGQTWSEITSETGIDWNKDGPVDLKRLSNGNIIASYTQDRSQFPSTLQIAESEDEAQTWEVRESVVQWGVDPNYADYATTVEIDSSTLALAWCSQKETSDIFLNFVDYPLSGVSSKWHSYAGFPSVSGGVLELSGGTVKVHSNTYFSSGVAYHARVYLDEARSGGFAEESSHEIDFDGDLATAGRDGGSEYLLVRDEGVSADQTVTLTENTWVEHKIIWESNASVWLYEGDMLRSHVESSDCPDGTPQIPIYYYVYSGDGAPLLKVDWVFVRKYTSPEPSFGSVGGEEEPSQASTVDSSTSSSSTAYSFQKKTWYDGTRYWSAFHSDDDDRVEFWYSGDGSSWTENTSARLSFDSNDFSVEADSSKAFILYKNGYDVEAREASSYPGTSFSWGSATTVYDGSGIPWYDLNWQHRIRITVQSSEVSDDQTDFPVYVNLDDLPDDFFSRVKGDGSDIVVTKSDGETKCRRELVSIDTGEKTGELYFEAPSLSGTSDTDFYIYYDYASASETNDTDTWGGDFKGVWHLEETDGTRYDSTNNENNLSDNGTVTSAVGQVGTSASFDNENSEYLGIGDTASLSTGDVDFTIEAWIYLDDKDGNYAFVGRKTSPLDAGEYLLFFDQGDDRFKFNVYSPDDFVGSATANNLGSPSVETWYHVVVWHDAGEDEVAIRINAGTPDTGATSGTIGDTDSDFRIGFYDTWYLDGRADEVRFSKTLRLSDYVTTTYNNQSSSSTFYAMGSEEAFDFDEYTYPVATRDSNNKIWTTATHHLNTDYLFKTIQSASANDVSDWLGASLLDTSSNSNKYGTIVSLSSGKMYAVWVDGTAVEGKNYEDSWGSTDSIATGVSGLSNSVSAVADSSGSAHLVYIDSSNNVKYQKYTTVWQTAVTLDSSAGNEYPTLSIDTAGDGGLYAFWIRSDDIFYRRACSPYTSWSSAQTLESSGVNNWITAGYEDFGSGEIFLEWTAGSSSPYSIVWNSITPTACNTAPTAPTIDNFSDGSWTNDHTPSLQFDMSDPDVGDTIRYQVQIDDSADFSSPVVDYTEPTGIVTPRSDTRYTAAALSEGLYYWRVRAFDSYNAESSWAVANSGGVAFRVDTTAPAGGGLSINSGFAYTASTSVTLTVSATDALSGLNEMMVSNNYDFSGASWEDYTASKLWTLTSGDGTKAVYIKFKDLAGNISFLCSDTIILSTSVPVLSPSHHLLTGAPGGVEGGTGEAGEEGQGEEEEVQQARTLRIKVVDEEGNPLAGVRVTLYSIPQAAFTDENGIATFKGVTLGEHRVVIVYDSQTGERMIAVTEEEEVITIKLEPTEEEEHPGLLLPSAVLWAIIILAVVVLVILLLKRRRHY